MVKSTRLEKNRTILTICCWFDISIACDEKDQNNHVIKFNKKPGIFTDNRTMAFLMKQIAFSKLHYIEKFYYLTDYL